MSRLTTSRTLAGAALAVLVSTFTLTPASAAAPVISWSDSITNGATYAFGQVPAAPTCTAVEEAVPVECVVTGYSAAVGTHELTATAVGSDLVPVTDTLTYTVAAWRLDGFYKPVRHTNDGVLNKAKGGSTVALKFRIYAGEAQVTDLAAVTALTLTPISCTDQTPLGAAAPLTSTRPSGKLRYSDDAFRLNWKTPKASKIAVIKTVEIVKGKGKNKVVTKGPKKVTVPVCYQVGLSTADGSGLSALFTLR